MAASKSNMASSSSSELHGGLAGRHVEAVSDDDEVEASSMSAQSCDKMSSESAVVIMSPMEPRRGSEVTTVEEDILFELDGRQVVLMVDEVLMTLSDDRGLE